MTGYVPKLIADDVRRNAGYRCEYCHLPQKFQEARFHIDHIIPTSKQGPTSPDNLALACVSCSLRKSDRTTAFDDETEREVELFHPKVDVWEEHFEIEPDLILVGMTPTGRVTVSSLALNRDHLLEVRRELYHSGGF